MQNAIRDGIARLKALNMPAGTLATTLEDAQRYIGWGFDFAAVGVDIGLLMGAAKTRLEETRNIAWPLE